jgi:hypothetical protein
LPLTLTLWLSRAKGAKPLVPLPSLASATVAVPLLAPALLVSTPTARALLLAPAASRLKLPLAVALPLAAMLALSRSEKPSAAAVLASVRAWLKLPPTRWSGSVTLAGVSTEAWARR